MTVSEAALADICQHPEDEAPRLIYVDWLKEHDAWTWDTVLRHVLHHPLADGPRLLAALWLDEHGDPDRAEFIRVQCELVRRTASCSLCNRIAGSDPNRCVPCTRLRHRERELLEEHRLSWAWPLPSLLGIMEFDGRTSDLPWEFRRGFVEEVSLTTEDFLRHARDLFRVAPLLRVTLSDREPYQGTAWVRQEYSTNPQCVAWELPSRLFDCLRDRVQVESNIRLVGSRANWYEYDNRNLALSALHTAALLWARRRAWPCPPCEGKGKQQCSWCGETEPCTSWDCPLPKENYCPDCHGTGHDVST